ncbi:restriction endonuclease subunit S [Peribacillus butanolivorans]|uniref:restriction endonuclease subunit S n=1 Tax=Peribacillus butanolivorans TaxID=421767 RepID=UPI00366CB5E2
MKYTSINKVLADKVSGEWGVEPEGDNGVKIIRTANFTNLGIIDFSNIVLRKIEHKKVEQKKLISGDIIIEKSGGSPKQPVGRVVFFENPDNSIYLCNNFTTILRPNKNKVFPKYLFYTLFYNHLIKKTLRFQNKTTGIINLKLENYLKSEIPLPPLDDQIRIATVLSRAETLIAKRKESIKKLDELLKSTFLEMFGPKSKDFNLWPVVEIRELAEKRKGSMRTGPFGSNLLHSEFTENGDVVVLGIDNAVQNKFSLGKRRYITMEKYSKLSSYRIFPGDVIITIMGTVGRSAVIPDDIPLAINTKHLAAITFDREQANPKFISYSIHSSPYIIKQFVNKNRGAIMNGLNLGIIKETKLQKPPIELQNEFAAIVEKVEVLKEKYNQSLTELENLYSSLSQRAFKGELELSKVPLETKNEIMELQEEEKEISTVDSELTESNVYSEEELIKTIHSLEGETFTFDSLMSRLEKASFEEMPEYGELKTQIYRILEGKNPLLSQTFDKVKKEIVLRVNL